MNINNITSNITANVNGAAQQNGDAKIQSKDFANTLSGLLDSVQNQVTEAETKMAELSSGKNEDIHGSIIAMEKADISIKFLMAIRNKVISAYQEISRMQV